MAEVDRLNNALQDLVQKLSEQASQKDDRKSSINVQDVDEEDSVNSSSKRSRRAGDENANFVMKFNNDDKDRANSAM